MTGLAQDRVVVRGQVVSPGSYTVDSAHPLTVLKLLAAAQGLTRAAAESYILRTGADGKNQEIRVPLKDILHHRSPDVALQPGDILFVPGLHTETEKPRLVDPPHAEPGATQRA